MSRTKTNPLQLVIFGEGEATVAQSTDAATMFDSRRREVKRKAIPQLVGKCPSCQATKPLYKGYAATLCQECHDQITEMASRPYR